MSVERAPWKTDLPWRVRWRQDGQNRSRSFATKKAADRFDRRVKDLRAAGELHLLDESPRGSVTLYDYTYDVWWPQYAETNLSDETRATYATQLDLRIMPRWGTHPVRTLEPSPIEAWVSQLRKRDVGDATILKTLAVFRAILKRAERDREIDRNPIALVAKPKQEPKRAPRPIAPYLVERMRALILDPPLRRDRRGRRIPVRDALLREMDATLVSVLAYAGPRPSPKRCRSPSTRSADARSRSAPPRAASSSSARRGCSSPSPGTYGAGGCGARRPTRTSSFRPRAASGGPAATGTTGASESSSRRRSRSACHATPVRATCGAASRAC